MIDTILDPMIWLVIVGLTHAIMGVIIPTDWSDDTSKIVAGFLCLTTGTILYTALMMEGEEQARLALVIAGPVWVWFVIICSQSLEWNMGENKTTMNWKENAPPLFMWGMCALSGLLGSGWL